MKDPVAARLAAIQQGPAAVPSSAPDTPDTDDSSADSARAAEAPASLSSLELPEYEEALLRAGARLHQAIVEQMNPRQALPSINWISDRAKQLVGTVATAEGIPATPRIRRALVTAAVDEVLGYGPIQPLLDDPAINEIIVNSPRSVWVEREGMLQQTRVAFYDNAHVQRIVQRMLATAGRRVDESSPMVDARLPDGSRLNVVVPPVAVNGLAMTIRKHNRAKFTMAEMVARGTLTDDMAKFLQACVAGKLNVLISGGTSSGKTSMLNALSASISPRERIITIEDSAELQTKHPGLMALQSRPPNAEGAGEVTIRDLVRNALRMRPDRIIVGEVRGGEAVDMLQAMLTGHRGSLCTIHGNSPHDTLDRLETMSLMAGIELPLASIRKQIASAIHLIIQQDRLPDGTRRVTHVTELLGVQEGAILLQNIFEFHQIAINERSQVLGYHFATGVVPRCYERLVAEGIAAPDRSIFQRGEAR